MDRFDGEWGGVRFRKQQHHTTHQNSLPPPGTISQQTVVEIRSKQEEEEIGIRKSIMTYQFLCVCEQPQDNGVWSRDIPDSPDRGPLSQSPPSTNCILRVGAWCRIGVKYCDWLTIRVSSFPIIRHQMSLSTVTNINCVSFLSFCSPKRQKL